MKYPKSTLILFFRQLSTLISAGISLIKSLEIILQAPDKNNLRRLIQALILDLESGKPFHRCLERHPGAFDLFCCQLIRIGEQTGTLDLMIKKITLYKEKEQALNSQIKQALFYPALVFLFTLTTSLILLLLVVPQFAALFQHFPNKIPLLTQFLIQISLSLQHSGLSLGVLTLLVIFVLFRAQKSPRFRLQLEYFIFKLPLLHEIQLKIALTRFSRYLAISLSAATPLSEGLLILAPLFKLDAFRQGILKVHARIQAGNRFYGSLELYPIFPSLLIQMVRTGEESGSLDLMLEKFAEINESELELKLAYLRLMLEPLIIAILGVLIGGVVIAMYLPIFRLGTAI